MRNGLKGSQVRVVDLIDRREKESDLAWSLFDSELKKIRTRPSPKQDLYADLNPDDFLCFSVVIDSQNELVGFSGLHQPPHFPRGVARCCTRLWISFKYQKRSRFEYNFSEEFNPLPRHMAPFQQRRAEQMGLKGIFWSAEYPKRKRLFPRIVERFNSFSSKPHLPMENLYNCSPPLVMRTGWEYPDRRECWQLVGAIPFDEKFDIGLPSITPREWHKRFGVK